MPSIDEFLELLSRDVDTAFKTYFFNIDGKSLDGDISAKQECRHQKVRFDFVEPNVILMSALGDGGAEYENEIWYLPWMHSGSSRADLDETGPAFFSTSQLDGCRFTIQYHDESRTKATVLHLAGNVGHQSSGSELRDEMEATEKLSADLPPRLTRRYSISKGKKSSFEKVGEDFSLKYDGNKASVFGFRREDGSWHFYAQQMMGYEGEADKPPVGRKSKGLRELSAL